MTLTANEQYFLELVNRARLDPLAEAALQGIDLNEGLAPGTLDGSARQVLASNGFLDLAAEGHSVWMLQTDIFSHTGAGGTDPGQRMTAAGYSFTGTWTWGENIAWSGTTGTINLGSAISGHHRGLFLSSGHRVNILNDAFREVGIAQVGGQFTANGTTYNASMATQNFAKSGTAVFLTGVVYSDSDHDGFYSIGEAGPASVFAIGGATDTSEAAGGYGVATTAAAGVLVQINQGGTLSSLRIDLSGGNAKLDLVGGSLVLASADLELVSGIADARLLGIGDIDLRGNGAANGLTGNNGANLMVGVGGADRMLGGAGQDRLNGGGGADRLGGGTGDDRLTGGAKADSFVFGNGDGKDRIADFALAQGDRLELDDALWGNSALTTAQVVASFAHVAAAGVSLDFGGGDVLTLAGLTTTAGLAGLIDIV